MPHQRNTRTAPTNPSGSRRSYFNRLEPAPRKRIKPRNLAYCEMAKRRRFVCIRDGVPEGDFMTRRAMKRALNRGKQISVGFALAPEIPITAMFVPGNLAECLAARFPNAAVLISTDGSALFLLVLAAERAEATTLRMSGVSIYPDQSIIALPGFNRIPWPRV